MLKRVEADRPRRGFFARRWHGEVPLGLLFWRDMVFAASLINITLAFAALMMLGFKAPLWAALVVNFAPLPYNIFLVGAVWRTADHAPPWQATNARFGAVAWLVLATLI